MGLVFGLPKDSDGNTGIVVFVDRLSKMAHLAAEPDAIDAEGTAKLFIDRLFDNTVCLWQLSLIETPLHWKVLEVYIQGAGHSIGHVHCGSPAN